MTTPDHTTFSDEVGAYCSGLSDAERPRSRGTGRCSECRTTSSACGPAADLLPRSVEQVSRRRASSAR